MLGDLLGVGGSIAGGLIANHQANQRFRKMMKFIKQVVAWQRQNLATAQTGLRASKDAFESDPRRARIRSEWESLLANPSSMTPEFVSSLKQNALSSTAKNASEASKALSYDAQRRGLGNSPLAGYLQADIYGGANRDYQSLAANIDTEAAQKRLEDQKAALAGYQDWTYGDLEKEYGFSKDMANLLGSVQYGNSLSMSGMG